MAKHRTLMKPIVILILAGAGLHLSVATETTKDISTGKYNKPVVYSNLPPPVLYFPNFPDKSEISERGDEETKRVEYVPFPFKELPLLVYQSDNQPPVHVVQQQQQAAGSDTGVNEPASDPPRNEDQSNQQSGQAAYTQSNGQQYQNAQMYSVAQDNTNIPSANVAAQDLLPDIQNQQFISIGISAVNDVLGNAVYSEPQPASNPTSHFQNNQNSQYYGAQNVVQYQPQQAVSYQAQNAQTQMQQDQPQTSQYYVRQNGAQQYSESPMQYAMQNSKQPSTSLQNSNNQATPQSQQNMNSQYGQGVSMQYQKQYSAQSTGPRVQQEQRYLQQSQAQSQYAQNNAPEPSAYPQQNNNQQSPSSAMQQMFYKQSGNSNQNLNSAQQTSISNAQPTSYRYQQQGENNNAMTPNMYKQSRQYQPSQVQSQTPTTSEEDPVQNEPQYISIAVYPHGSHQTQEPEQYYKIAIPLPADAYEEEDDEEPEENEENKNSMELNKASLQKMQPPKQTYSSQYASPSPQVGENSKPRMPTNMNYNKQRPLNMDYNNNQKPLNMDYNNQKPLNMDYNNQRPLSMDYNNQRPLSMDYNKQRPLNMDYNKQRPLNMDYNKQRPLNMNSKSQMPTNSNTNQQKQINTNSNQPKLPNKYNMNKQQKPQETPQKKEVMNKEPQKTSESPPEEELTYQQILIHIPHAVESKPQILVRPGDTSVRYMVGNQGLERMKSTLMGSLRQPQYSSSNNRYRVVNYVQPTTSASGLNQRYLKPKSTQTYPPVEYESAASNVYLRNPLSNIFGPRRRRPSKKPIMPIGTAHPGIYASSNVHFTSVNPLFVPNPLRNMPRIPQRSPFSQMAATMLRPQFLPNPMMHMDSAFHSTYPDEMIAQASFGVPRITRSRRGDFNDTELREGVTAKELSSLYSSSSEDSIIKSFAEKSTEALFKQIARDVLTHDVLDGVLSASHSKQPAVTAFNAPQLSDHTNINYGGQLPFFLLPRQTLHQSKGNSIHGSGMYGNFMKKLAALSSSLLTQSLGMKQPVTFRQGTKVNHNSDEYVLEEMLESLLPQNASPRISNQGTTASDKEFSERVSKTDAKPPIIVYKGPKPPVEVYGSKDDIETTKGSDPLAPNQDVVSRMEEEDIGPVMDYVDIMYSMLPDFIKHSIGKAHEVSEWLPEALESAAKNTEVSSNTTDASALPSDSANNGKASTSAFREDIEELTKLLHKEEKSDIIPF